MTLASGRVGNVGPGASGMRCHVSHALWWAVLVLALAIAGATQAQASSGEALRGQWQPLAADATASGWQGFSPQRLTRIERAPYGARVRLFAQDGRWPAAPFVLVVSNPGVSSVELIDPLDGHRRRASLLAPHRSGWIGTGRIGFLIAEPVAADVAIELELPSEPVIQSPLGFAAQSIDRFQHQQNGWVAFVSACFAVMLSIALMASAFGVFLRDRTFLLYGGYVLAYALVLGIQNGFVAHPLGWRWIADAPLSWGRVATALSVTLACLFAERFMRLEHYAPRWRRLVLGFAALVALAMLPGMLPWPAANAFSRALINPLLIVGGPLLLVAGAVAARHGSRYAWFFLAGWVPLLIVTVLSSAQVGGAFADALWLPDANLAAGAMEALVLSMGLADRSLQVRRERDRVQELADTDALTGLPNRRHLLSQLNVLLRDGRLRARPIALLFLDLDHFKQLNDRHGHHVGDDALCATARALENGLRDQDLLGRYGGEEFVIALPGSDRAIAEAVAERLREAVAQIVLPGIGASSPVTVSIGLTLRRPGDDAESLLVRADQAMYEAKEGGRNRVVSA